MHLSEELRIFKFVTMQNDYFRMKIYLYNVYKKERKKEEDFPQFKYIT